MTKKATKSAPAAKKVVPAKKAGSAKKTVTPAKKVEAVKKAEPVKKATPAKKAEPVKKAAPAPAKKAAPAPAKKAAPAPAKKAAPAKKEEVKEKAPVRHKKLRLSKSKQKKYRELLMRELGKFSEQVAFHREDALSSKKDSAGERAGMATHMADLGSDNFRHDIELGQMTDEGDVLEMIEEAFQRLEVSEYGICLECGCEIPASRLEAKPYARYCVRCKSAIERMEEPHRRHR